MRMVCLMNHRLLEEQMENARAELGVREFVAPPGEISGLWSRVNPHADLEELGTKRIISWIEHVSGSGDFVLVQGDYALTFAVADWCLSNGRRPVHATTERNAVEKREGGVTVVKREFRHVKFREYERFAKKQINKA